MILLDDFIFSMFPYVRKIEYPSMVAYDENDNVVEYDLAAAQAEFDKVAYKEKRAAEYPPFTDYLDGVVKGDQAQIDAYIAACLAVKQKYPKPGI
jgi:hypothetical protein